MEKVALITGGSRGLGATLAAFLAGDGYDLILTARDREALERAAHSLRHFGGSVDTVTGDVADAEDRARVADRVRKGGRLDLLVNNASILGPSPLPPLSDYPVEQLRRVLEVNTLAPLALVQELLDPLRTARGTVINVSSDAASGGYPGWGGYGASKAALDLLSLTLARELKADGISVISVDPGDLRTRMHQEAFPGQDISDRPLPEVTIPFWAWLLGREPASVSGGRFRAQDERWEGGP